MYNNLEELKILNVLRFCVDGDVTKIILAYVYNNLEMKIFKFLNSYCCMVNDLAYLILSYVRICPLCKDIIDTHQMYITKCEHMFHKDCIVKYYNRYWWLAICPSESLRQRRTCGLSLDDPQRVNTITFFRERYPRYAWYAMDSGMHYGGTIP
jgi:hypothetical protein